MENISNFTSLEVLKLTKEIVINEHIDRRAEIHNRWLVESEHLWKTRKLRLAYPSIPPYPTEVDIVLRAKVLLEFLNSITYTQKLDKTETPQEDIVPESVDLYPQTHDKVKEDPVNNVPVEELPFSGNLFNTDINTTVDKFSVLKHFENIKNSLRR